MILFLANQIGGTNGNVAANLDILISLLLSGKKIGTIAFKQADIPKSAFDNIIPNLSFSYQFSNWPPTHKDKEKIIRRLSEHEIDLVLNNDLAFHNLFGKVLFPKLRISQSYRSCVLTQTQPKNYPFALPDKEMVSRFSDYDHFISVSQRVIQEWRDFGLKQDQSHCHCVPNCCSQESAETLSNLSKAEVRKSLNIGKDLFVSVCVATLQDRKNQRLIIKHLDQLLENDSKTHFYFVGPKSDYGGDEILTLIKNHPQCDRIHLTGEVSDAMSYIRAADLLLLPSLGEVMPLSILEAMALKTPVLASNVGGIPEMIEDETSGFLFDLKNSTDFVKKFLLLKKDSSLRKQLAKNAYSRYHSSFSRMKHTERWKTTLKTILHS
tara:strand:- start:1030 stop:2169 length:1140 start_codon:yes stop_codon:yes gene_type:complete